MTLLKHTVSNWNGKERLQGCPESLRGMAKFDSVRKPYGLFAKSRVESEQIFFITPPGRKGDGSELFLQTF